jgi:hypothetical protein
MRHSNMIGYVIGCVGILPVGAALAKEPEQTAERGLSTPAGCTDSVRGRTHILRFCGDEHYWIKRPVAASQRWSQENAATMAFPYGGGSTPISIDPNR